MPTIELKSCTNCHDSANDKCEGPNPPVKHNDTFRFTESFRINFALTSHVAAGQPIGCCETAPFWFGMKYLVPAKSNFHPQQSQPYSVDD